MSINKKQTHHTNTVSKQKYIRTERKIFAATDNRGKRERKKSLNPIKTIFEQWRKYQKKERKYLDAK